MPRKKRVVEEAAIEAPLPWVALVPKKKSKKFGEMAPEELAEARKLFTRLEGLPRPNKRTDVASLPRWVKAALLAHTYEGKSWKELAEQFGRSLVSMKAYKSSPAAKAYMAEVASNLDDPLKAAQMVFQAEALSLAHKNFLHLDAAEKAGDRAEVGKQLRYLTDKALPPAKKEEAPTSITINLTTGSITAPIPMGDSTYEKVLDADIIEE